MKVTYDPEKMVTIISIPDTEMTEKMREIIDTLSKVSEDRLKHFEKLIKEPK